MADSIYMPVRCAWGNNCVCENSDMLVPLGKSCLIVTGKNSAKSSGALDDAINSLEKHGISYKIFDEIGENPLISACHRAGDAARKANAEFILGIGGGSVLDGSKAIAIYASNPDLSPIDIYKREYKNPALPVALIGTTAGTGSEVTAVAVLTNDETGIKKSVSGPDCYASVAFCDPKYTASMPYKITVSTALDAFAHAVEGYFTQKCNGVLRVFAEKCIPELYRCLEELSKTDTVPSSLREPLYYSSIYAGLVINTCGTAFPHPLGYVLTENYGVPHGMACAAFFAPYIERCAEFSPEKFNDFCRMTDDIEKVKSVIASLTDLSGAHISEENAKKYALRWQSVIPRNFTASPGGLTQEEAAYILSLKEWRK
ncbi:MAG: iron-containing alcohol dehydrogenase [Acutalibacteraceae bacterium]|nr:iron-containing alcohol dehydrogenase [Acutalibacteraceae bacterium]